MFVAHSWSPVSGDFDCVEKLLLVDVNVGNDRQPASHADPCDVQRVQSCHLSHLFEVVDDVVLDGFPHVVVGLLHFAVGAGVFVFDLN